MGRNSLAILIQNEDRIKIGIIEEQDRKIISGRFLKENKGIINTKKGKEIIKGIISYSEDKLFFKRFDEFSELFPGGFREQERYYLDNEENSFDIIYLGYPSSFEPTIVPAFFNYFSNLKS